MVRASLAEPPSKGARACEVMPVLYAMGISETEAESVLTDAAKPLSWEVDPDEGQRTVSPDFSNSREESLASNNFSDQKSEEAVAVAEHIWDTDVVQWKANVAELHKYLLRVGIDHGGAADVFMRCPQLLRVPVEDARAAGEFIRELGIEEKALGRVLVSEPTLLCFKVEAHLKPAVEYILQTGVPSGSIGILTTLNANLLSSAVDERIRLDRTSSLFAEANKADKKLSYVWAASKAKEARDHESRVKQGLIQVEAPPPPPVSSASVNAKEEAEGDSAGKEDGTSSLLSGATTDQQKSKYLLAASLAARARQGANKKKGADRR